MRMVAYALLFVGRRDARNITGRSWVPGRERTLHVVLVLMVMVLVVVYVTTSTLLDMACALHVVGCSRLGHWRWITSCHLRTGGQTSRGMFRFFAGGAMVPSLRARIEPPPYPVVRRLLLSDADAGSHHHHHHAHIYTDLSTA